MWRIWAKALGEKSGKSDREADFIAIIRTFIFIQLVVTNCFIIAGTTISLYFNLRFGKSEPFLFDLGIKL